MLSLHFPCLVADAINLIFHLLYLQLRIVLCTRLTLEAITILVSWKHNFKLWVNRIDISWCSYFFKSSLWMIPILWCFDHSRFILDILKVLFVILVSKFSNTHFSLRIIEYQTFVNTLTYRYLCTHRSLNISALVVRRKDVMHLSLLELSFDFFLN